MKKKIAGVEDKDVEYGEEQMMRLSKVRLECKNLVKVAMLEGDLIMTNYKVVFKEACGWGDGEERPGWISEYVTVPLSCIYKIDKAVVDKKTTKNGILEIYTKDFRDLKFTFENTDDCNNAMLLINMLAFPENEMHDIFAFSYFYPVVDLDKEYLGNGWDIYRSPQDEFIRQGINFNVVTIFPFNQ